MIDNFSRHNSVFGEIGATRVDLLEAGYSFIRTLFGIPPATARTETWHQKIHM